MCWFSGIELSLSLEDLAIIKETKSGKSFFSYVERASKIVKKVYFWCALMFVGVLIAASFTLEYFLGSDTAILLAILTSIFATLLLFFRQRRHEARELIDLQNQAESLLLFESSTKNSTAPLFKQILDFLIELKTE